MDVAQIVVSEQPIPGVPTIEPMVFNNVVYAFVDSRNDIASGYALFIGISKCFDEFFARKGVNMNEVFLPFNPYVYAMYKQGVGIPNAIPDIFPVFTVLYREDDGRVAEKHVIMGYVDRARLGIPDDVVMVVSYPVGDACVEKEYRINDPLVRALSSEMQNIERIDETNGINLALYNLIISAIFDISPDELLRRIRQEAEKSRRYAERYASLYGGGRKELSKRKPPHSLYV